MMMNLLAVDWKTLGENAMNFFVHFSLLYAMEILMFFALIFFVSKMLRDNDATKLMVIYWLMIVAGGCLHVFVHEISNLLCAPSVEPSGLHTFIP